MTGGVEKGGTRATDDTALRDQLKAFHAHVFESIKHIRAGWPSTTRAEVRNTLASTNNAHSNSFHGAIDVSDRDVIDKAIDVALCLWLSVDCVDRRLGAEIWSEGEKIEQFVLKHRFVVAVEVDHVRYFPPDFRAGFLKEISGIRIEQTYYLDQHLRFNEETRTVRIFMDIGWLKAMIRLFKTIMDTADGLDGNQSPANATDGQANAGCQQNIQVDAQDRGDSQSQEVTQKSSSTPMKASPTGNKEAAIALLPIFEEALHTLDVLFPAWHSKTIDFLETFREDGNKVPWFTLQDLNGQYLHNFRF